MKSTILQKAIKSDEKRILYKNYPIQRVIDSVTIVKF